MSSRDAPGRPAARGVQGLAFLVVLALLLGLSVAIVPEGASPPSSMVTLQTDHRRQPAAGRLRRQVRGLIVGEVRDGRRPTGDGARRSTSPSTRPGRARSRPNVSARLLPKTLFGERYVDARDPRRSPPARPIRDGDVIAAGPQLERHRAAEGLRRPAAAAAGGAAAGPLAHAQRRRQRAARPRQRSSGSNLVDDRLPTSASQPVLPQLQADISELADFADTYDAAAARPARRPGQPLGHQPDRGRPAAAAAAHLHRRSAARRTPLAGFLHDQRAEPDQRWRQPSQPVLGRVRPATRPSTPACSTG